MCSPSTSVMAPCSESCCELLFELRDGILWLSPPSHSHTLSHFLSLLSSFSLSMSSLHPANASHSFYPGFPPGSYGATSAHWHLCQLLLSTTSTVDQFVPVCLLTASHSCVFFLTFFWDRETVIRKKSLFLPALSQTLPPSNSSYPH